MENHSIDFKIVSGHPLVAEILTKLRNSSTDSETFRRLGKQITKLLLYESIAAIETEKVQVETPLALAQGEKIKGSIIIVPSPCSVPVATQPYPKLSHLPGVAA